MCDSCWIRHGGMNPSGNACLSKRVKQRLDLWVYIFQPSHSFKVKQSFNFQLLTHRLRECWNSWPLWLASPFPNLTVFCMAWNRANNSFLSTLLEWVADRHVHMIRLGLRTCLQAVVPLSLDGCWYGSNVHVIHFDYWQPFMGLTRPGGHWAWIVDSACFVDASFH